MESGQRDEKAENRKDHKIYDYSREIHTSVLLLRASHFTAVLELQQLCSKQIEPEPSKRQC